ncbi:hypothetical protein METBIDRAFT_138059 [Metschnikowia bicuspidata var. bicuspidata NRRL YB-4993]|uniref:Uncharacterized protein n=1 Tax=Metschnikowia bicuspidata var. bicuspidata NRRL YB-4993 TaxID=869754 RepID=A0A1A0HCY8_9ASCO|nr:hypothetical protein METBIDRAFT_138059 [Metschnikowia bicuspidata var. bicuspidata NRRL YB-4993]OBA21798.1 hypothetical protein METBIDRAFT_138059 [Metschnikowia bicuspidata var. bicuspidata NRRL YB-4993]
MIAQRSRGRRSTPSWAGEGSRAGEGSQWAAPLATGPPRRHPAGPTPAWRRAAHCPVAYFLQSVLPRRPRTKLPHLPWLPHLHCFPPVASPGPPFLAARRHSAPSPAIRLHNQRRPQRAILARGPNFWHAGLPTVWRPQHPGLP